MKKAKPVKRKAKKPKSEMMAVELWKRRATYAEIKLEKSDEWAQRASYLHIRFVEHQLMIQALARSLELANTRYAGQSFLLEGSRLLNRDMKLKLKGLIERGQTLTRSEVLREMEALIMPEFNLRGANSLIGSKKGTL